MEWKLGAGTGIWLTTVDIHWTREHDDVHQSLHVMVEAEWMHCEASMWIGLGKTRTYNLTVKRRHIIESKEVSALFNEVYFNGKETAMLL